MGAAQKFAAQGWPTTQHEVEPPSLAQLQAKANGVPSDAPGTNAENQRQGEGTGPVTSQFLSGLSSDISKRAAMFAKEAGLLTGLASLGSKGLRAGGTVAKTVAKPIKAVAKPVARQAREGATQPVPRRRGGRRPAVLGTKRSLARLKGRLCLGAHAQLMVPQLRSLRLQGAILRLVIRK